MTIDDFHACSELMNIDDDDNMHRNMRMLKYQEFVEYHAAIMLYNFGIMHQCSGMAEDGLSDELRNHAGSMKSNSVAAESTVITTPCTDMTDDPCDNHNDDVSTGLLFASYKILTNTLSWIHKLVQPIIEDDMMDVGNDDTLEISTAVARATTDDHHYLNKYLQIMVLINFHILDIIDTLNYPDGPFEYHYAMMHEILNLISYSELFYPFTIYDSNSHNNNNIGNGNTRGSASPAA